MSKACPRLLPAPYRFSTVTISAGRSSRIWNLAKFTAGRLPSDMAYRSSHTNSAVHQNKKESITLQDGCMLIDDASHSCIGNTLPPCSEIEREQEVNKSEFSHSRHHAQGCSTLCGFNCRLPPCSKVSGSIQRSIRRDFSTKSQFFLDQLKCSFVTGCDRPIESRKFTYTRNKRNLL